MMMKCCKECRILKCWEKRVCATEYDVAKAGERTY